MRSLLLVVTFAFLVPALLAATCTSNTDCVSSNNGTAYCKKDSCDATATGVCTAIPINTLCPLFVQDPGYCGCDGNLYGNPCLAEKAGVNIDPTNSSCPVSGGTGGPQVCSSCFNISCPAGLRCCDGCGSIYSTCSKICPAIACVLTYCSGCGSTTEKGCTAMTDSSNANCKWCPSSGNTLGSVASSGNSGSCVESTATCPVPTTPPPPAPSSAPQAPPPPVQTCDVCNQNKDCPDGTTCCACGRNGTCSASCGVRCLIAVSCDNDACATVTCPAGSVCVKGSCVSSCDGKCTSALPPVAYGCTVECAPTPTLTQTNLVISSALTCQWRVKCPPPPVVCALSGCGQCVAVNTSIDANAATLSNTVAPCLSAATTDVQKSCAILRAQACQSDGNGGCAFTKSGLDAYNDCVNNVPPPPPICKGISNPCICNFTGGCVFVSANPAGTPIAACLPPAQANQVVQYVSSSAANGAAPSATSTASANVITALPPICLTSNIQSSAEAKAVASNVDASKIMQQGFDLTVASSALGTALSQASDTDITTNAYVIVAFGVPTAVKNGVNLTVLVDVYGTFNLNQNALAKLCLIIRKSLAASAKIDDTILIGCDLHLITPSATSSSVKRMIEQTDNTTHLQVTSTLPNSSGSGAATIVAYSVLVILSILSLLLF